jgi:hypothetical protein
MPVRDEYLKAKNDAVTKYYPMPTVRGIGVGKPRKKEAQDSECFRVYLEKPPLDFKNQFGQFWVDPIVTGRFVSFDDFGPGSAIALDYDAPNVDPTLVGTLGAAVKIGEHWFALGSNHVMAMNGRVPILGRIMFRPQDRFIDDPSKYVVARLAAFVPLRQQQPEVTWEPNEVDCALAAVEHPNPLLSKNPDIKVVDPKPGMPVKLAGRNGAAIGVIEDVNARLRMDYRFGTFDLDQMVLIKSENEPLAKPGDSGSLLINDDNQAVAIVVGGADNTVADRYTVNGEYTVDGEYTVACYLTKALEKLIGVLPEEDRESVKDPVNDPKLYLDCIRFGVENRAQYNNGPPHHEGLFKRLVRDVDALKRRLTHA